MPHTSPENVAGAIRWRRGKLILANDDDALKKYRDRAEERRKGHNPDYADKLNQMASMDAETTKYLGGDVEHTHLVKGLDYALLVKIREEEKQRQMETEYGKDGRGGERGGARAEVRARTLIGKTVLAVIRKLHLDKANAGPNFRRVRYEFDLEVDSTQEIPTAVAHGVGEDGDDADGADEEDREQHSNYLMEEDLLERVQRAFTLFRQHGGKTRRHRKRVRERATEQGEDAIVAALAKTRNGGTEEDFNGDTEEGTAPPIARKAKTSINIFETADDRYVPAGAVPRPVVPAAGVSTAGASGYFSGLRAEKDGEGIKNEPEMPTRAEMSATVKAAARAAAARLASDGKQPLASASGASNGSANDIGGKNKIERDIFAARPSRGQALGVAAGGYDVYPETGDFETYDSDEDTSRKKGTKEPSDNGPTAGGAGGRRGGTKEMDSHPAFDKPKASFPFGVKKSEMSARKSGGSKGTKSKHRIDNELNIIKKYMKGAK